MANHEAVDVLNQLIHTSEDGEKGFNEAARIAQDPKLILLFQECAKQCHGAAAELQARVSALGGKPDDRGSIAGAAHRGWVKAKASVADSDVAVLEEVERGEDHAKASYARALKANLPADIRQLVQQQLDGTVRNHDRIRDLRDRYRARAA